MIDLSKLKADETPVKNVNIKIGGETQAVEIRALKGEDRICLEGYAISGDAGTGTLARVKMCLQKGAGLTADETDKLIAGDWKAAFKLANEVMIFSMEYEGELVREVKEAEKNSETPESSAIQL